MASYSTITAAIALGIDRKRLENLLLRHRVPGTFRGRQGRARRLSRTSLLALAVVVRLQDEFGIPAPRAVELLSAWATWGGTRSGAARGNVAPHLQPDAPASLHRGPFTLTVDVAALERDLVAALAEAIEVSPRPRRGRPAGTARSSGV